MENNSIQWLSHNPNFRCLFRCRNIREKCSFFPSFSMKWNKMNGILWISIMHTNYTYRINDDKGTEKIPETKPLKHREQRNWILFFFSRIFWFAFLCVFDIEEENVINKTEMNFNEFSSFGSTDKLSLHHFDMNAVRCMHGKRMHSHELSHNFEHDWIKWCAFDLNMVNLMMACLLATPH